MNKEKELKNIVESKNYTDRGRYAISVISLKLRMIQETMEADYHRNVINKISSRIKSPESIIRKLQRKELKVTYKNAVEKLNDLIGIRATCFYKDDIYKIADRLSKQKDIEVVKIKDYIKNPKGSGYQSYHMIVDLPIYIGKEKEKVRVEIQFRTVAMDFWAQLDYQLCYKKELEERKYSKVTQKLAEFAKSIAKIDDDMSELRKEIEKL